MDMDFIAEDLDNDMEEEEDDDDGEEELAGDHDFPDDEKKREAYGKKGSAGGGASPPSCLSKNAGSIYRMPSHKVCEVHCKAAVVVDAGLMQRFCQQRGRFHELLFDAAKRSSQRRLAGDNKRQRKSSAESSIEGSSRIGTSHPSKGSHCRQVDDQRGRVPTIAIPEN